LAATKTLLGAAISGVATLLTLLSSIALSAVSCTGVVELVLVSLRVRAVVVLMAVRESGCVGLATVLALLLLLLLLLLRGVLRLLLLLRSSLLVAWQRGVVTRAGSGVHVIETRLWGGLLTTLSLRATVRRITRSRTEAACRALLSNRWVLQVLARLAPGILLLWRTVSSTIVLVVCAALLVVGGVV